MIDRIIHNKNTAEKKFRFLIYLFITLFLNLSLAPNVYSQGIPLSTESTSEESLSSSNQSQIDILQKKVKSLDDIVSKQALIIEQQQKSLEKIMALVDIKDPDVSSSEPTVLVKRFIIDGANLFSPKDFEKVLDKYRDKEISMTGIKSIADEITAFYRKKGYITTSVYVPEQEISDNTVEFKVVEARIGDIVIEESKYAKVKAIKNRLLIEKGQILNSNKLESNLRVYNQHPDRKMRAVLSPGAEPETSDILLKVEEEESPHHFYADFNNRGSKNTSKNRWGLNYVNNNITGRDDVLSVKGVANEQVDVYSVNASYDLPVSKHNTRAGIYGAYSKADIGGQFAILTPQGYARVWGLYLNQPILDKKYFDEATGSKMALTGNLTAGFDSSDIYNKILGNETSHDELRVFKIGMNFEEMDDLGRGGFNAQAFFGIPDFLGSMGQHSDKSSRIDAGGKFQKYIASFTRVIQLPASSVFSNTFKYQYTSNALVNSQQFVLGGADSIRGFPENEYFADFGWSNSVELRTPIAFFPPILKVPFDSKHTLLSDATQLVLFIDAGKGYLNNARVGETAESYLVGAGFGLRLDVYEHLSAKVDIGFPLNKEPNDKSAHTVYFGMQYEW